jgi:hypothetical protein
MPLLEREFYREFAGIQHSAALHALQLYQDKDEVP